MKISIIAIILLYMVQGGEVFNVNKCENLFFNTERNNERQVINACAETWGAMQDREYYPNY